MNVINQGPFIRYGGFGTRLVALIIDYIILGAVQAMVFVPLLGVLGLSIFTMSQSQLPEVITVASILAIISGFLIANISLFILGWLYFAGMESSLAGGTIGKRLMGLKVADLEGRRIDFWRASGRYFAKIFLSTFFCIGFIIAAFTPKKQALHDFLSGCTVLKK